MADKDGRTEKQRRGRSALNKNGRLGKEGEGRGRGKGYWTRRKDKTKRKRR